VFRLRRRLTLLRKHSLSTYFGGTTLVRTIELCYTLWNAVYSDVNGIDICKPKNRRRRESRVGGSNQWPTRLARRG
jgi:hypothetical protein